MISVSKSRLKARMLDYFRRIEKTGEELVVTHNKEPVLKVLPLRPKRPAALVFADLRGKARYKDRDLLAPTTGEWEEA